jgi:4-hydroxybenzoate polyprenyltransferase
MSTPVVSSSSTPPGIPWSALARLIRLPNQTGTYLLLLPTMWALILAARGFPPPHLLTIFIGGSFLMRSAGVIFNDLADQSFDRQVSRTKTRPLASGELSRRHAFTLLTLLLLVAASLMLALPPLVAWLSPIAVFLAALYPFSKRWIHIPQAMLGIAFGWGTIMAWAAVREQVEASAWLLFGATAAWAVAYDTIYAIQDQEDDRRIGVKSAALYFGSSVHQGVGLAFGIMLAFLTAAGWLSQLGWPYYTALLGVAVFFLLQINQLRRPIAPSHAFDMFRKHVWVGVAILAGLLAGVLVS